MCPLSRLLLLMLAMKLIRDLYFITFFSFVLVLPTTYSIINLLTILVIFKCQSCASYLNFTLVEIEVLQPTFFISSALMQLKKEKLFSSLLFLPCELGLENTFNVLSACRKKGLKGIEIDELATWKFRNYCYRSFE